MSGYDVFISLLPLAVFYGLVILSFIVFSLIIYPRRPKSQEVLDKMHPTFVGVLFREWWYWLNNPFIILFTKLKFTPNNLTGISLVLGLVSGYFFYRGDFALAGWLLIVSGTLDILDGRLARVTNQSTNEGAFFDSCADRFAEAAVFMGLTLYFLEARQITCFGEKTYFYLCFACIAALSGSELVSYTKARAEAIGVTTKMGLMQRPERVASLAFIAVLHPFFSIVLKAQGLEPHYPLIIILILMAVLTNYTAVARMIILYRGVKK